MTTIKITYAQVLHAEQEIGRTVQFMSTKLDQMEAAMKKISAEWEGEAQAAYHAKQSKINAAESSLIDTLTRIKGAVHQAVVRMQSTDSKGAQVFGG